VDAAQIQRAFIHQIILTVLLIVLCLQGEGNERLASSPFCTYAVPGHSADAFNTPFSCFISFCNSDYWKKHKIYFLFKLWMMKSRLQVSFHGIQAFFRGIQDFFHGIQACFMELRPVFGEFRPAFGKFRPELPSVHSTCCQ
jgi:hypothetical protein